MQRARRIIPFFFFLPVAAFGINPLFVRMTSPPSELMESGTEGTETGQPNIRQQFVFPRPALQSMAHDETRALLPGTHPFFREKMPEVPMLTQRLALPPGSSGTVHLEDVQMEQSTTSVALHTSTVSYVWSAQHDFTLSNEFEGRYFPGKLFEAKENDGYLHLTLFPLQVDRTTGRLLMLRSVNVRVDLTPKDAAVAAPALHDDAGVIVTSEKLRPAAELLRKFHADRFGVKEDIVTVETIAQNEKAVSEDDLPNGYKKKGAADDLVVAFDPVKKTGYDYELAKKIISFLQKKMGDAASGQYVTLLGDATVVPPSYYFSVRNGFNDQFGVTDQCYAAKSQCQDPRLSVGRLPFTSVEEVQNYLSKVNRWLTYAATTPSELSLFGGKAFQGDVFVGELGTLRTINSDKADWRGVKKNFRTTSRYTKPTVLDLLRGKGPSSFVYYLDHGNGNQWYVEDEYVSSTEILAATDAGPVVNPVIVSIACTDAAFDETLTKETIFGGGSDGKQSIGVSMLKSKAGAVAYLGSARPAVGVPIYNIDTNGNLNITSASYGLQLLDTFFEKYGAAKDGSLGGTYLKAMRAFLFEHGNDMSDQSNVFTYFNAELLGDPALRLPKRNQVERDLGFAHSSTALTPAASTDTLPQFLLTAGKSLELIFDAPANLVGTLYKISSGIFESGEQVVWQKPFKVGKTQYEIKGTDLAEGDYFLRLENAEGVPLERQVWFTEASPQVQPH